MESLSYIPGLRPTNPGPLARFLPPLEDGVVAAWLADHFERGEWLLDPFGSSPRLALEAARAGYRVLVTANNPVTRFLLEMAAAAPSESELKAALAELAASRKGEERLEAHLQSLYLTACANCGREVSAQAFLWRRDEKIPFGRVYACKACGDSGERLVSPADVQRAEALERTAGLHRARVLERVAPLDDPDRQYAEEAIQHYLPRPIYALATLINRLEALPLSPERRRALTALILTACDAGNNLWPHPTERPRPRQLTTPPVFRENNLWLALEEGVRLWTEGAAPIPCLPHGARPLGHAASGSPRGGPWPWPKRLPESGGILLYEGRLKDLAAHLGETPMRAVIGALPRPNQAFWTLSALWAGWLWGREAVEPFKVALRRRRYDWGWHTTALHTVFHHLFGLLALGTPFFGLLAEPEPPFLAGALMAASSAGFGLHPLGLALRTQHDPAQIHWQRGERLRREIGEISRETIGEALRAYLRARGEPASYLSLYSAALTELERAHALYRPGAELDEALRAVQSAILQTVQSDPALARQDSAERSPEVGLWDLAEGEAREQSLADRVETAIVEFLQQRPESIGLEIEAHIYPQFPGLLTPSRGLIYAVLASYAVREGAAWRLRDEDRSSARQAELERMAALVEAIGGRLNFATRRLENGGLAWVEKDAPARVFYLLASALVRRVLSVNPYPGEKCLLVIPGGRASLLAYKQQREPRLRQDLAGWRSVKFRLLRALAEIPILTRETFEEQIAGDPVEQAQGQMMMF